MVDTEVERMSKQGSGSGGEERFLFSKDKKNMETR